MKVNFLYATAIILVVFMVANLLGVAMGAIDYTTFWLNIAVVWVVSFMMFKRSKV